MLKLYHYTNNWIKNMQKITWEELIQSGKQKITLIWYGSLLNTKTHHSNHKVHPVIFYWFIRKYNLPCVPNKITPEWKKFAKNYLTRYGINCEKTFQEYLENNYHVLNCEYTWNPSQSVNGLAVEIYQDEFHDYALREEKYDLYSTDYFDFNPDTWEIWEINAQAYVLVGKSDQTSYVGNIFQQYHKTTRDGAYNIWLKFWEYFDATTQK